MSPENPLLNYINGEWCASQTTEFLEELYVIWETSEAEEWKHIVDWIPF